MLWSGDIGCFWLYGDGVMRNHALAAGFSGHDLPRMMHMCGLDEGYV